MQLNCPFCGPRDEAEFTYGGDAAQRLLPADGTSPQAWLDSLYLRENTRGQHTELWFHAAGCQQWLQVERHTVTHAVAAVRLAGDTAMVGGA